jgi:mitochondrial import inner membrane translocase subunit TIM21
VFHNNLPSAVRPRHRNDRVVSQSGRDAYGRETMLLNFFLEAKGRSNKSITQEDQSLWESASEWASRSAATVSDMSTEEAWQHTKDFANDKWESARRLFRFLSGDTVPASKPLAPVAAPEVKEVKQDGGWVSGFVGLFSGIRGPGRDSGESSLDTESAEGYMEGEVQAMLVMVRAIDRRHTVHDADSDIQNDNRQFEFRYLRIDIPGEHNVLLRLLARAK